LAAAALLAAAAYLAFALLRTLPEPTFGPALKYERFRGRAPALAWPHQGEAAIGVEGVGLVGAHGSNQRTPIASVAKVMTAYLVLRDHRLGAGSSGPTIPVGRDDVAAFRSDLAAGQSVVAVRAGERLTERQALEGLLLPSGNNIAQLLATWDAGSQRAFVARMNAQARALGLRDTHYADASGVSARTVSTAADQSRVAMRAFGIPAFRRIVDLSQVTLPVAGRQFNLNRLLGQDGIVGIKTGSTSQAGGCFVFAARQRIAGQTVTVVGAVLHQLPGHAQPSIIAAAFGASTTLLASIGRVLVTHEVIRRHATVTSVKTPWSGPVPVIAARAAPLLGWPGLPIHARITTAPNLAAPLAAGQIVGTAVLVAGRERARVRLLVTGALPQASLTWRLSHP
jgi:D-alanyl-D-alanine carboxypeptidase (penicillin-binding protein 5/6)